ncbi:hypothetical protein DBO93_17525 [Colwellia sp. Arc7-D]|nr:hypothetical protein DBO93_17525 [Colwellia sp. Arc7-D]
MDMTFRKNSGFTLIEMSLVLVIIGLILGAVSISGNLQKSAATKAAYTDFIYPWAGVYRSYHQLTGRVLGDSAVSPSGRVNGSLDDPICLDSVVDDEDTDDTLRVQLLNLKMDLPTGRGEFKETNYVVTDKDSNPRQIELCFAYTDSWIVGYKDKAKNNPVIKNSNVMIIKNLPIELAEEIDVLVDKTVNGTTGLLRWESGTLVVDALYKLSN